MSHQGHHESHTHRTSSCGPAVGDAGSSDGEIALPWSCMKSCTLLNPALKDSRSSLCCVGLQIIEVSTLIHR